MHVTERERAILRLLSADGFISFRELARQLDFPHPTLRHDLQRMATAGLVERVHGGVKQASRTPVDVTGANRLHGIPFQENVNRNRPEKAVIGRTAASLCRPGEAVMIDGGSTTLSMCPYLAGLDLQVLTNSLHIVAALMGDPRTRLAIPGGALFREQNIILSPPGDDLMPNIHAPRLFMGAAAVGPQGVMQADVVLVAAERSLIDRAEELILLVDSAKFQSSSGNVVCALDEIDIVVTDEAIAEPDRAMLVAAGVRLIIAEEG